MKFILKLSSVDDQPALEVVFVDARRLGRIRLCTEPLSEPPISNLGFDPILSMPLAEKFVEDIKKRKCTIKSLLLDQSFSAGIGNWIADEVLFHAGIHPEQKPNLLDRNTLLKLHEKIKYVCETAVSVDADASQFPEGWLFKHRWVLALFIGHFGVLMPTNRGRGRTTIRTSFWSVIRDSGRPYDDDNPGATYDH